MSYSVQNIRNVCLLGHSGSGKTSLAESLLFMTGAIDRMGRVADGNTVCDYDPEEVKRQISLSTAVAPIDYKGCRINVLDTPGAFDFSGEVMEALRAADAAIIVASAKDGVSVGVEKAWKYCEERNMPRFIYISKIDEDHSDYNATFDALRERFGNKIAPVVVPTLDENKKVTGLMDILNKRAYEMQDGKRVEIELPEEKVAVINEFNDALKESVAETSEEFMERFFNGEDFTYAEMAQGLRQGVRELSVFPVLCGSAVADMGTLMLLDNIMELLPSPEQGNYHKATLADGTTEEFVVSAGGVPTAFVFKTISDQYGKYSFVKVLSGSITPDMTMVNARTGDNEKLGRLYTMRGKKATEVKELVCGDIGAIAKMDKVKTGDTAELVNFWGGDAVATLDQITSSQTAGNRTLVFTLTGDIQAGQNVTLSIGQKSANYDALIPLSGLREDSNGKFVYVLESKSSPLGSRYIATRVTVQELARDDKSAAVSGISSGDFIITTSNKPIEAGKQVRLADNG